MSFWTDLRIGAATPIVIGHRGAPESAVENTRESFTQAIACGVQAVETDLRLTADDEVVCLHDGDLLRVAGVAAEISSLTLAAARALFPALLTFTEFVELTGNLPVIVDVKHASARELDAFMALCRGRDMLNRALLTAYTPEIAHLIRDRARTASIGLFFPQGADCLAVARVVDAAWIRVLPKDYRADAIERLHDAGFAAIAVAAPLSSFKTPSDGPALAQLRELKIDGVITDTPDFAVRFFQGTNAQARS
jgi:glycerophosphoryl diester phosphodiesterase